jgi:peptidoglycan-associated lipoprotein
MNRTLLLALAVLIMAPGCKKKGIDDGMTGSITAPPAAAVEPAKPTPPPEVQQMAKNFERVFFDFDSSSLNAESKKALDDNAGIMGQYSDVKLEVQGHADERGTTDYNMALGQKRADAVVQYLLARGVSSSRVKSVSYGEERPLDGRSSETAWAMNRRAEFVITWSGSAPVAGTVSN